MSREIEYLFMSHRLLPVTSKNVSEKIGNFLMESDSIYDKANVAGLRKQENNTDN